MNTLMVTLDVAVEQGIVNLYSWLLQTEMLANKKSKINF